jgi:hypothetical protein
MIKSISYQYHVDKINFVSIPRCASNAVHKALKYDVGDNHKSIRKTKDERFSFAIIRDPLERLMSWWKYHQLPQYDAVAGETYKCSFIDWVLKGCPHHWTDDHLKTFGIDDPMNQWEFICDPDGNIIVDQLVRFDDIDGALKLPQPFGTFYLQKINASPDSKHVTLSKTVITTVFERFKKDYQIFNSL